MYNVREVFSVSKNNQETVDAFMDALADGKRGNAVLDFSGEAGMAGHISKPLDMAQVIAK